MTASSSTSAKSLFGMIRAWWSWLLAFLSLSAGVGWFFLAVPQPTGAIPLAQPVTSLVSGAVARMDSPVFVYSDGWHISPIGADPTEPGDAWNEPAGQLRFVYSGRQLALQLAVGDYWGYMFVTVDGTPTNRLAVIPDNENSQNRSAGYKPLLAPERHTSDGPTTVWFSVHSAVDDGPHEVTVEVWRSWGQMPLRGVAVDAMPSPPLPLWPGVAFVLAAVWSLYFGLKQSTRVQRIRTAWGDAHRFSGLAGLYQSVSTFIRVHPLLNYIWFSALLLVSAGVILDNWLLTCGGLALLGLAALVRPEMWVTALLFGLPFYLHPLPILPGRALNLIEIGIWGGLAVLGVHWTFLQSRNAETQRHREKRIVLPTQGILLALLLSFALLSALAAQQMDMALREWRTVFLAAGGFSLLLGGVFSLSDEPDRSWRLLVNAWLLGGTVVALIALWQFVSGQMIIQAEGVTRVRGLYGSPNNLALYLERTVAVAIGYWGVGYWGLDSGRDRQNTQYAISNLYFPLSILIQLVALVLTFSKGALFLGIPAMLLALGVGGVVLLARQGKPLRFLWWLVGIGGVVALGLLPFLGTDRFRLLLDFGAGTTGGLRLNLWRSAWAMALDHPWLGIGPDNFLYAYRSSYILPAAWQDPSLNHPHNLVLDWWTRLGLPGLVLAALWLGTGVRRLWRQLQSGENAGLALGCLAAAAAALAHGLIDASYALPDLMLVWVLLFNLPTVQYPRSPRPE